MGRLMYNCCGALEERAHDTMRAEEFLFGQGAQEPQNTTRSAAVVRRKYVDQRKKMK